MIRRSYLALCAVMFTLPGAAIAQPGTSGACCLPSGLCIVTAETFCTSHGGTFQGAGAMCGPDTCPPPVIGACCLSHGFCAVVPEGVCTTLGGMFRGADTTCETVTCTPPPPPADCPCDWNGDGVLTSADVAGFIHDWVAQEGDFNEDGFNNSADVGAFLLCWLSRCQE
jgi:hypothetical protein